MTKHFLSSNSKIESQFYTNIVHIMTFSTSTTHVHIHFSFTSHEFMSTDIFIFKHCPQKVIFYNIMSMDIFVLKWRWQFCTNIVHMRTFLQYHVHGHIYPQMKVTILHKYCPHEDIFYNIMSMPLNEGGQFCTNIVHM